MPTFNVRTVEDVERLLGKLETEKEANTEDSVDILLGGARLSEKFKDLFWKVLSHPHSKIFVLRIQELAANGLDTSGAVPLMRRWCHETPIRVGLTRALRLQYSSKSDRFCFEGLREALTHPNARVALLCIAHGPANMPLCSMFLRHILQYANNVLSVVVLSQLRLIDNEEAKELAMGLSSRHCILQQLDMAYSTVAPSACLTILDGLLQVPGFRRLEWWGSIAAMKAVHGTTFVTKVARLLEKPGNRMESLSLTLGRWNSTQVSILADSLKNDHCRLVDFKSCRPFKKTTAVPLLQSLRHPNCSLRSLSMTLSPDGISALRESLKSPNCVLESLLPGNRFDFIPDAVPTAVADALSSAPFSTLAIYEAPGTQTAAVFQAFARSLACPTNKLLRLVLQPRPDFYADQAIRDQFFQSLRTSSVIRFGKDLPHPFFKAFNAPFFQVLHTLLSIKHIPTLGWRSPLRILPVQDLILVIAQTLGWPVDDLRTTSA